MKLMLNHGDSPYIRCIGFLYLRFTSDPSRIWHWFEPYLYDNETFRVHSNLNKPVITIGKYVRSLVTEMDYYGTLLPRLPLALEREMKVKLLQVEHIERRAKSHLNDTDSMNYFQKVGSRVRAMYGDDENPLAWYDAVIERVVNDDNEGNSGCNVPKFVVSFPEYGNTEVVMLGEIDIPRRFVASSNGKHNDNIRNKFNLYHENYAFGNENNRLFNSARKSDKAYSLNNLEDKYHTKKKTDNDFIGRRYKESYPISYCYGNQHNRENFPSKYQDRDIIISTPSKSNETALMEEVLRREREKCAAKGKAYASRPATFKKSITLTERDMKQSHTSPSLIKDVKFRLKRRMSIQLLDRYSKSSFMQPSVSLPPGKRKTQKELDALEEKRRKLIARYG